MKKYLSILLVCISLGCENKSDIDARRNTLDHETADSGYTASFGITDGPLHTATQGLFDGDFFV